MRYLLPALLLLAACDQETASHKKQQALDSAAVVAPNRIPEAVAPIPITYPDSDVTWSQLQQIVRADPDSILAVQQTHSLTVSVAMRDGRRYRSKEPVADAILKLLRQVDPAGRILIATE